MSNPYKPGMEKAKPTQVEPYKRFAVRGALVGALVGLGGGVLSVATLFFLSSATIGFFELLVLLVGVFLLLVLPAGIVGAMIGVGIGSLRRDR